MMDALKATIGQRYESGYLSLSEDLKGLREGIYQTFHNILDKSPTRAN
jgi:hypothetical protein